MRHIIRPLAVAAWAALAVSAVIAGPTQAVDRWITTYDLSFRPARVTIDPGDTVTFVNDDEVAHNAVGTDWSTVVLGPYDSDAVTFDRAGTYPFRCSIHPQMRGTVIVAGSGGGPTMTDPPTDTLPIAGTATRADRSEGGLAVVWVVAAGLAAWALIRRPVRLR